MTVSRIIHIMNSTRQDLFLTNSEAMTRSAGPNWFGGLLATPSLVPQGSCNNVSRKLSRESTDQITVRVTVDDALIARCIADGDCPVMVKLFELLCTAYIASCSPTTLRIFNASSLEERARCSLHREMRAFVAKCDRKLRPSAIVFDLTAPARFFSAAVRAQALR